MADGRQQVGVRNFLQGLSSDELGYIAEFFGACILETLAPPQPSRTHLAESIAEFERLHGGAARTARCTDHDHKIILLREYLSRSGVRSSMAAG
jgi:hypothetical protein